MNLENKTALVTGASRGIGLAITKALLDNGVMVVGWSRTEPKDFHHEHFYHIKADLTQQESVEVAYQQTEELFGGQIHILINNAGLGYKGLMEEMPPEKWRYLFDLNVHGIFYVSRLVIPQMKTHEEGHIINISSGAGTNGIAGMSCYSATKHAVVGISRSLHQELRDFGIKVTCLSPGSVDTGFSDSNKNKLQPDELAESTIHILQCSQNFHYTDVQVRPLQP
ncbi:SDR family NAD(P)-dependent oxidoreductase [Aliifodinibius salicampi]|uniref:SDR family NAD(P)-dependent oxidoreductase n=1 Tax=Fodinibius salicampi TaxID=1920655 RepID=A0ABT3PXH6_9BACT|nr:SDR family NAD(P)-dependent oxidoreductase [Fodinibius salicampi]MCW9712559.1 SDR family NAD(P)-dependent oxidoreductase [Fodinibius salicampi]